MGTIAPFAQAFADAHTVGIDTNTLIDLLGSSNNPRQPLAKWLFGAVGRGHLTAVVSVVTEAELLVRPLRLGDDEFATELPYMLSSLGCVRVVPLTRELAARAARIRAAHGVTLPDAMILATAIASQCDTFVTADASLASAAAQRLQVINPDDFVADNIVQGGDDAAPKDEGARNS